MRYWHGEDREVYLMLLRLSVLTGKHANSSQIITKRSSLFTQFMITLLYKKLSIQIPLIFINISRTIYLLTNHLICTISDTEQIVILILHYLIIQNSKMLFVPSNSYMEQHSKIA